MNLLYGVIKQYSSMRWPILSNFKNSLKFYWKEGVSTVQSLSVSIAELWLGTGCLLVSVGKS